MVTLSIKVKEKKNNESQFRCFLDVLKQLHINIPLVETFKQMPSYVKFLKDILSRKGRIGEFETVALTQECSIRILAKMKDPRSFTIFCSIGDLHIGKVLCDLEQNINLMPLFVFKKLGIESRPTTVEFIFNVFKALEYPNKHEKCQSLDAEENQMLDDERREEDELDA